MLINNLKLIYDDNQDKDQLFLRNLLKEQLQFYVLNFIYNSDYGKKFIFKGGTCLRFCFGLPRLSEDLDFDVKDFTKFSFKKFSFDISAYFKSKLQYKNFHLKISGKNNLIYLKFPLLQQIGFPVDANKPTENILFVRIDLSAIKGKFFKTEVSLKSTADFSFLIKRYSLSDLFSGKILAILERHTKEGEKTQARFKGRDYFDLFWFMEKGVEPNYKYLQTLTKLSSKKELIEKINLKVKQAVKRKVEIKKDLLPFFANQEFVKKFVDSLEKMAVLI